MLTEFVVQIAENCWLADVDGDPGRTMVLQFARRWKSEKAAQRALNRAKRENRHRHFNDATVVQVSVNVTEIKQCN